MGSFLQGTGAAGDEAAADGGVADDHLPRSCIP